MKPKLSVVGASGRMGKRIIALAKQSDRFDIIAAIEQKNHPDIGKDAGTIAGIEAVGIQIDTMFPPQTDIVIDFSLPQAADATIDYCLETTAALVLGTTGLTGDQQEKIKRSSKKIPLIYGTNMSAGMNVLFSLVGRTASMLGDDYDIEIVEQHHRFKKDAPSGSALTLAQNICEAAAKEYPNCITCGRHGKDALRKKGNIGIHAVRAGDITGVHSVIFSTLGETIILNHTAHSRDCFATGALRAAQWLLGKSPGSYSMADVLNLK